MPPRTVKRGAGSAGTKRTTKATRATSKAQNQAQPDTPDEPMKAEVSVPVAEAKEELKVEGIQEKPFVEKIPVVVEEDPVVEEKPIAINRAGFEVDAKSDQNGLKSKFFLFWITEFLLVLMGLTD